MTWRHAALIGALAVLPALQGVSAQTGIAPGTAATPGFELPRWSDPGADRPAAREDRVFVEAITFEGHAALSTAELDRVARPYLGRELDAADLEDLRLAVTRWYVQRGYVNSGALWDADAVRPLAPGSRAHALRLKIVEGRIQEVSVRGLQRLHEDYLIDRLLPDRGAALNTEALRERYQLLLEDPLFERLNARLRPGRDAGQATLEIDVTRAPAVEFGLYANNYRPPSIGADARGTHATVRNATGMGDTLELSWQGALRDGSAPRGSIAWRWPLGDGRDWLSLQTERGRSAVIEEPARELDIRSDLRAVDLGAGHVLHHTLNTRLAAGVTFSRRVSQTWLLGEPFSFVPGEPGGRTALRSLRLWQEWNLRSEQQAWALRSTFTRSLNNLQPAADLPATAVPLPGTAATFWLGQGQFEHQFVAEGPRLRLRSVLQWTGVALLALDRLSLGGAGSVRGFRENQLVRDTGAQASIELTWPLLPQGADGWQLDLSPFFDAAAGRNVGEHAATLASWGLAAQARWHGVRLDVARGIRLKQPSAASAASSGLLQDKGLHLQLSADWRFN